jgi:hypothetical protein
MLKCADRSLSRLRAAFGVRRVLTQHAIIEQALYGTPEEALEVVRRAQPIPRGHPIRDPETEPKAFPSTFHPPSDYQNSLRKHRGNTFGNNQKALFGHKPIQEPGGRQHTRQTNFAQVRDLGRSSRGLIAICCYWSLVCADHGCNKGSDRQH